MKLLRAKKHDYRLPEGIVKLPEGEFGYNQYARGNNESVRRGAIEKIDAEKQYRMFSYPYYQSERDYNEAEIDYIVPMTAKEFDEERTMKILDAGNLFIEEKFDGTRGILHFCKVPELEDIKIVVADELGTDEFVEEIMNIPPSMKQEICLMLTGKDYMSAFKDCIRKFSRYLSSDELSESDVRKAAECLSLLVRRSWFYPQDAYTRVFSRRVSNVTGWFVENTDSVPQLRDLCFPDLDGTIIDGEMFIPSQPFKAVASTLNCLPDKAIARQKKLGGIVFHAFDILKYKGTDLRDMPLRTRKQYLINVIKEVCSPFIKLVPYFDTSKIIHVPPLSEKDTEKAFAQEANYPHLCDALRMYKKKYKLTAVGAYAFASALEVDALGYYEYIVFNGGEGAILKDWEGKYYHKRAKEYLKLKKFLTRDCIVLGFTEPTKEYKGKFPRPDKWRYWEIGEKAFDTDIPEDMGAVVDGIANNTAKPISKFSFYGWVGNVIYGVLISQDSLDKLKAAGKKIATDVVCLNGEYYRVLVVGECAGYDEEERERMSNDPFRYVGRVVEIKANEIFRDTGKLRHPRVLRFRDDKNPTECTFEAHVQ